MTGCRYAGGMWQPDPEDLAANPVGGRQRLWVVAFSEEMLRLVRGAIDAQDLAEWAYDAFTRSGDRDPMEVAQEEYGREIGSSPEP